MARVWVVVVLVESKCAQFLQPVLNWSIIFLILFFSQSWSVIVGKKQWVLVRTYCSSTCPPPVQHLFCFFRLNSQASSASAANLSQSQFYKEIQEGKQAVSYFAKYTEMPLWGVEKALKGLFASEAEGLGRHHLWAGRGKPWGPKLRVDPVQQLCFCANWGKPQAKKQQLNPFFFFFEGKMIPSLTELVSGLWEGEEHSSLEGWLSPGGKAFLGKIHGSQNMQTWERKKFCRKDVVWWICEIYVGHWRAMPSRGSKPKPLLPKLWEAGRENHL